MKKKTDSKAKTNEAKSSDKAAPKLVKMKRDPETYPEPHTADVHPDEVENYALGGFEKA